MARCIFLALALFSLHAHGVEGGRMIAGHQTMLRRTVKYPWDYRVEYFEVASLYPLFECGPLWNYNEAWKAEDTSLGSDFQRELMANFNAWLVFSFPNAASTDQKVAGNYGNFTVYPYSSRYNIGGFNGWLTQPSTSAVSQIINTNTKTNAFAYTDGNDVRYGVSQGDVSWSALLSSAPANYRRFRVDRLYPVFLFDEGGYQVRNVSIGTRFYESGFDIGMSGDNECHIRFVPCMLDGEPYICEMYSGTLIPNSMSGTVTPGPQVADDYQAWSN